MRASTTEDNEAYSDSDARIDPFIYVAALRSCAETTYTDGAGCKGYLCTAPYTTSKM
ncbi:MAG: hypothetical protein IJ899_03545 [Blautia sp.]|nr:hypothetical protein [Blautia sp.]